MTDNADRWCAYARLQKRLDESGRIDDYTSGLEDGLNRLLEEGIHTSEDVARAVRSGSRKERYRQQLHRAHPSIEVSAKDLDNVIDARHRLRLVKKSVTVEDFWLLRALGEGYDYSEIASTTTATVGSLRIRALRLRRLLAIAS